MTPTPQTIQQIERAIRKVAEKFPPESEPVLTDIHLQVKPDSGEILAFNDEDEELNRCVVEQWIGSPEEFYDEAAGQISRCLRSMRKDVLDNMSVMHPFSFVLVDDEHETLRDIYLVDDDAEIISGTLLEGLDEELNRFFEQLMA